MPALRRALQRHWFSLGLLAAAASTLLDPSGILVGMGNWLGSRHIPEVCVAAMFLLSGLALDARIARKGITDLPTFGGALAVIFIAAPLLAAAHVAALPLPGGLAVGLVLVGAMPTTLSSGVIMAQRAGGNPATALMITLSASGLAILTIPPVLELLLGTTAAATTAVIDKPALALRLATLVLAPLAIGLVARTALGRIGVAVPAGINHCNLALVLVVVWIALSRSHNTLQQAPRTVLIAGLLATSFHGLLLAVAALTARCLGLGPGRRETVWLLGAQKTLPVALLLQTALFPEYGDALVFCVVHHVLHLSADGILANHTSPLPKAR